MKRKIRDIAAAAIGYMLIMLGFVSRAKKRVLSSEGVLGVYFHNPERSLFEKSIKWLRKNGFKIITAETLLDILQGRTKAEPGMVWISLDDGWKNNMTNVVPYAAANNVPVTFFISTEPVEASGVFWWRTAADNQDLLDEPFRSDLEMLWKVPESKRSAAITALNQKLKGRLKREAMTVDDVKQIASYSFMNIESHTVHHVITPNCTSEELRRELGESKRRLESWTGREVKVFSYPNGDYTEGEKEYLTEAGYTAAVIQKDELITQGTDIYQVPRYSIGEGYFAEELCHMFGVWQTAIKKLKGK
ncbi:MAG: polysaccharide deacetylase family protein [Ignavibacteria bacterium]|nr:polysaccharide deacetylase family protein [Ignavibacteria bacterium]